jgi:hypothetical protein
MYPHLRCELVVLLALGVPLLPSHGVLLLIGILLHVLRRRAGAYE